MTNLTTALAAIPLGRARTTLLAVPRVYCRLLGAISGSSFPPRTHGFLFPLFAGPIALGAEK